MPLDTTFAGLSARGEGFFGFSGAAGGYITAVSGINTFDPINNITLGSIPLPNTSYTIDIKISPDGSKLYAAANGFLYTIDTSSNSIINSLTVSGIAGFDITPDGQTIYFTTDNGVNVGTINTSTNSLGPSISTPTVTYIAADPVNPYVYAVGAGGPEGDTVVAINTISNTVTHSWVAGTSDFYPQGIAVSSSGTYVTVPVVDIRAFGDGYVGIYSAPTGSHITNISIAPADGAEYAKTDSTGTYLYIGSFDETGAVLVFDAVTFSGITTILNTGQTYDAVFSTVNNTGYFNASSNTVQNINTSTNTIVATISGFVPPNLTYSIAILPNI